ncbi:hypothetical protein KBD71_00965 [Candidatus Woesebacteria bacterium]|nr:hypothetical protein [Candidatus Woesebacteria bacterium]
MKFVRRNSGDYGQAQDTVANTESSEKTFPLDVHAYPLPIDPALSLERELTIGAAKGYAINKKTVMAAIEAGIASDPDIIAVANQRLTNELPINLKGNYPDGAEEILGSLLAISDNLPVEQKLDQIRPFVKFEQGQFDDLSEKKRRGLYIGIALLADDVASVQALFKTAPSFEIPTSVLHVLSPEKILRLYTLYTEATPAPHQNPNDSWPTIGYTLETLVRSLSPIQRKDVLAYLTDKLSPDHPLLLNLKLRISLNIFTLDAPFEEDTEPSKILSRMQEKFDARHPDRNISVDSVAIIHLLDRIKQLPVEQQAEQRKQLEALLTDKKENYRMLLTFFDQLSQDSTRLPDGFWDKGLNFTEKLRGLALLSTQYQLSPEMLLHSALDPAISKEPDFPINTEHVYLLQRFFDALAKVPSYSATYLPEIQTAQRRLFYLGGFKTEGYLFVHAVGRNPKDTVNHLAPLADSPILAQREALRQSFKANSLMEKQMRELEEMMRYLQRTVAGFEGSLTPLDQQFIDRVAEQGFVIQAQNIPLIESYLSTLGIATDIQEVLAMDIDVRETLLSAIRNKIREYHTDTFSTPTDKTEASVRAYTAMKDSVQKLFVTIKSEDKAT